VKAAELGAVSVYASCTCSKLQLPGYGPLLDGSAEPIFPSFLRPSPLHPVNPLAIKSSTSDLTWYRPIDMKSLLEAKSILGVHGKIVGGNTEIGIDTKFRGLNLTSIICVSHVREMREIKFTPTDIVVGGAATLTELRNKCQAEMPSLSAHAKRVPKAISDMLRWFASNQIRNVASKFNVF
jgi:xanthine dehydrogenase/oxidase